MEICNGQSCGTSYFRRGKRWICIHNNLEELYSDLSEEWDYIRNKEYPKYFSTKSNIKVWWICKKNRLHRWGARICKRTEGRGCPYCTGKKVIPEESLAAIYPEIAKEWDYERNKLLPEEVTKSSNIQVWWICKIDDMHNWKASPNKRVEGKGCPCCRNLKGHVPLNNSILKLAPGLCEEWDPSNDTTPKDHSPGSNSNIKWICKKNSNHRWITNVYSRATENTGCPWCINFHGRVPIENSLFYLHPTICKYWDYNKNDKGPERYSPGSKVIIWWLCDKKHSYSMKIYNKVERFSRNLDCPLCINHGFSKKAICWLESIQEKEGVKIQHGLSPEGEYYIPEIGKVDGYCYETNTVYEFHGNYWHGNPKIYPSTDVNTVVGKTFGELYRRTIDRDEKIRKLNYNLIVKWEDDTRRTIKVKKKVIRIKRVTYNPCFDDNSESPRHHYQEQYNTLDREPKE